MTLQRFAIELETLAMTPEDERAYPERGRRRWLVSRARRGLPWQDRVRPRRKRGPGRRGGGELIGGHVPPLPQ